MRLVVPVVVCLLWPLSASAVDRPVADALAARNPVLLDLRSTDPATFEAAVDIVARAQAEAGVETLKGAPPPPPAVGRGSAWRPARS